MGNPGACLIDQGRPARSGLKIMRLKVKKEVLERRSEKKQEMRKEVLYQSWLAGHYSFTTGALLLAQ